MDFKINKPMHIFALLLVLGSFLMIIGIPIITVSSGVSTDSIDIPDSMGLFFEIFAVLIQTVIFIVFMILIPILWYMIVNKLSFRETLFRMRLRTERLDMAFLWGVITLFLIFIISVVASFVLIGLNYNLNDISEMGNIEDIALIFSPISMFFILAFQPVGEEIFFRGFLLEKIDSIAREKKFFSEYPHILKLIPITVTGFLFGIAHFSYGKWYPVVMTMVIGFILAAVVYRSKNLYSAIIAHILFNVISFAIFLIGSEVIGFEALIL